MKNRRRLLRNIFIILTAIFLVFVIRNDAVISKANVIKIADRIRSFNFFSASTKETAKYKAAIPIAPVFNVSNPDPLTKTIKYTDSDNTTEVQYTVKPESFDYIKNTQSIIKPVDEVMFVVDCSKDMNTNAKKNMIINGLVNQVIVRNNKLRDHDLKVGTVGYSDRGVFAGDVERTVQGDGIKNVQLKEYYPEKTNLINPLFGIKDGNSNDGCQNLFKNKIPEEINKNNNSGDINQALKAADNILSTAGENSSKAIVIISGGRVNYEYERLYSLNNKGYKIISIDLSNDKEAENNNINLHTALGGNKDDWFKATYDGGNYNHTDDDMGKVSASVEYDIGAYSYAFDNVVMSFDVGDNFDVIPYSDGKSAAGSVTRSEYDNGKLLITLKNIQYKMTDYDEKSGQCTHKSVIDSYKILFKIKPKEGKKGELKFNESNNLIYKRIGEDTAKAHEHIVTPIINVISSDIKHGVYKGKGNIEESSMAFAENSIVPMAAVFDVSSDTEIKLVADRKGSIMQDPNVYKIVNGEIKPYNIDSNGELSSKMTIVNGIYTYAVTADNSTKILVLYNYKVIKSNEGNKYTNTVTAGGISKDAEIITGGDLPDLY